jgi:putative transposase
MREAAQELAPVVGVTAACAAVGLPRSSFYHAQQPARPASPRRPRLRSHRALSPEEEQTIRELLNSERFVDQAPRTIYATLLDAGEYFCSWRTMYRILKQDDATRERRAQRRRPTYAAPELLAIGPCQVWSWDITKLRGPYAGIWYSLYVVLDIFSRKIVGWRIETREDAELAEALIAESYRREGVQPHQLTLHADRGAAMTSKTLSELLMDLGVAQSHSRPTISDDNPYSESQFKTMKYDSTYPERFASLHAARAWMRQFAEWYNHEHKHSGIALLPPAVVHSGQAEQVLTKRQETLNAAYEAHPERFPRGRPQVGRLPKQVGINLPRPSVDESTPATSEAQPAATPASRVLAAQRPLDAGDAVGQAAPEVLVVELTNAPHFVEIRV